MATTEILPFATGGSANVETQAAYAADPTTGTGFATGVAPSAKLNKVWRQSSFVAAGLANWLVARGISVPDDGNVSALAANIASGIVASINSKIQPVSAAVAANALTATLNPTVLDFRSSSLTSGTVNTRTISSAINVVVPSSATLGTVNATKSRLAILAIDNAGAVELAICNISGGINLDETTLISTTAISAGSTASNVVYSTTARSNVPFRVVGFIESTQATAGTWATAPSTIQGYGGQAFASMASLGFGQTWQNLIGSRSSGTTYYNTTGKPIIILISSATSSNVAFTIDGVSFPSAVSYSGTIIVGPGQSYSCVSGAIQNWMEFR